MAEQDTETSAYAESIKQAEQCISNLDLQGAREIFTELSVKFPKQPEAWLGIAKLDFMEDDFASCARHYRKCHLTAPTMGIFHKLADIAYERPDKLLKLAQALYQESLYEESLKFTDKLVEMDLPAQLRTDTITLREDLRILIEKQMSETQDQSLKKGEQRFKTLFNVVGVVVIILILVGIYFLFLYFQRGPGFKSGLDAYELALKKKENFKIKERGWQEAREEFKRAEKIFLTICEKDKEGKNASAHFYLAKIYIDLDDLDRLIESIGGEVQFKDPNLKMAEDELEKTLQIDPNYSEAYIELAALKIKDQKLNEAKADLEKAFETVSKFTDQPDKRADLESRIKNMKTVVEKKLKEPTEEKKGQKKPEKPEPGKVQPKVE